MTSDPRVARGRARAGDRRRSRRRSGSAVARRGTAGRCQPSGDRHQPQPELATVFDDDSKWRQRAADKALRVERRQQRSEAREEPAQPRGVRAVAQAPRERIFVGLIEATDTMSASKKTSLQWKRWRCWKMKKPSREKMIRKAEFHKGAEVTTQRAGWRTTEISRSARSDRARPATGGWASFCVPSVPLPQSQTQQFSVHPSQLPHQQ
jgi:hypothetical protein